MVYYTYSQGFRPGGFNQNGGTLHAYGPGRDRRNTRSRVLPSDKLTNNEIGWKTEFFDHRLQWNGAVYRENWDNVQVAFFNPGVVGNIFYNTNGQNFLIKGLETSLVARVAERPDPAGRGILEPQRADQFAGADRQQPGQSAGSRQARSRQTHHFACVLPGTRCAAITNPFGPIGAPSADAPPLQFSLRARYEWNIAGYMPFVQAGATHNGIPFTQAGSNPTIAQAGAITTGRGAVRESGLHDLRCLVRRRQGCHGG